jgi:hypothetical protein
MLTPATPSRRAHSSDSQKCGRSFNRRFIELAEDLLDASGERRVLQPQAKVADPGPEELLARELLPSLTIARHGRPDPIAAGARGKPGG